MIYIALSILGVAATLTVKSTWSYRVQSVFILSVIGAGLLLFLSIHFTLEETGIINKGNVSILNSIPWLEIWLYLSMTAGMAAKYFYDWIGDGKTRRKKFDKWQMVRPMFVSPVIFGAIYGTVDQNTSIILLLIFSFQNGFFWQTILKNPAGRNAKSNTNKG